MTKWRKLKSTILMALFFQKDKKKGSKFAGFFKSI